MQVTTIFDNPVVKELEEKLAAAEQSANFFERAALTYQEENIKLKQKLALK